MENSRIFILQIKDILEQYTDDDNWLTQQEILRLLKKDGIQADRRSVSKAIETLSEYEESKIYGLEIIHDPHKGYSVHSRLLDISEAEMLVSQIYGSHNICQSDAHRMATEIESLFSIHQRKKFRSFYLCGEVSQTVNRESLLSLDTINEAINTQKRVSFNYIKIDENLKETMTRNGYTYVFSPAYILCKNGMFYVLGVTGEHQNLSIYKITEMTNIQLLDQPSKSLRDIPKYHNFSISQFLKDHIYPILDKVVEIKIMVKTIEMVNIIKNQFGSNADITKEDGKYLCFIRNGEKCIKKWLSSYSKEIKIINDCK